MTEPQDVDSFRQHALWTAVDEGKEVLEGVEPRSATDRHTIARGLATLAYLGEYRSLSPYLFPSNRIDQLQSIQQYVRQLIGQIEAWDQSAPMSSSTARQVDGNCDGIMNNIAGYYWPALKKESRAAAIAGAADAFRLAADASLLALEADADKAQTSLQDVDAKVEELRVEATDRASEAEAAAQAFRDALSAQDIAAKEALALRLKEFNTNAADAKSHNDVLANEHLDALKAARGKAAELLAFVTDGTVAGGYSNFASEEKRAYRYWNGAGIAITLIVVGYLSWEFREISSLTREVLWVRTLLSVPALGVSAYCFQQAAKRHKQFVDARYRALDLVALPPFSDSMREEEQSRLRMVLGERLFAREEDGAGSKKDGPTEDAVLSAATVQSLTDLIKLVDTVTSKRPG